MISLNSMIRKSSNKNFVKEQSKVKIIKKPISKQYVPGVYSQHHPSQCEHMLNARHIHLKGESATEGKEMLKIVTQENVRNLLVPSHNVNIYPTIWQSNELNRIKSAGKIVSRNEKHERILDIEKEKQRMETECNNRKMMLKRIDTEKLEKINQKLPADSYKNVDGEIDDNIRILDRAFLSKQEQSEEVKKANRLILATKCHVIRDAQIAEKNEIERELRGEDLRLEELMRKEREKAIIEEKVKREKLKQINEKHAVDIKDQLKRREMIKIMEAERIEEEAKVIAAAQIATKTANEKNEQLIREQKRQMRSDLQKANELSDFFKNQAFEQQRIADMKAQEYMRMKQESEKQMEHEKQLEREQKQREADRLLVLQTKMFEIKNEQEEMVLRRNQEEKEREFRRKEKEAAVKRKLCQKELETIRAAQMEELKKQRALEIIREESYFNEAIGRLKKDEEKEKEKQRVFHNDREKYRSEIICQINEKNRSRKEVREASRKEFLAEQKKEQERNKNIQIIINSKINAMRKAKIPENFVKDVERQLNISKNS